MRLFKQYLKITSKGGYFRPSPKNFPQLIGKGPFPHVIWEEGTTDFWFVDEKGFATYTPNFWSNPSNPSLWISQGYWIAEPMNPRFVHSHLIITETWEGYRELIDEQIWHVYHDPDKNPYLFSLLSMKDLEKYVKWGTWKQIPPIQNSPTTQPKPEPIPARKPALSDIFRTL